jgi:hypothetical protein
VRKLFEWGGYIAGAVLIVFGIVAIVISVMAFNDVRSNLKQENIVGSPDMTPTAIQAAGKEAGLTNVTYPTCSVAGEQVTTGAEARCFAEYMRIHALEASGGKTYAEMSRYATADGKGTNDPAAAQKDANGQPVSNAARDLWVTETALTTALNVAYMGEQLAYFGIVVGIALILAGIGFIVLTLRAALRSVVRPAPAAPAPAPAPA